MAKKAVLKLKAYQIVERALGEGLSFALNRLEDYGASITEDQRQAAMDSMLNELSLALEEVVDWDLSG